MKVCSKSSPHLRRRAQSGRTFCDTVLILATAFLVLSVTFNWVNRVKTGGWDDARLRKIAEKMVNVANNAQHAGVTLVEPASLEITIQRIAEGRSLESGPYAGKLYYGVRELDHKGQQRVRDYLKLEAGHLVLAGNQDEQG